MKSYKTHTFFAIFIAAFALFTTSCKKEVIEVTGIYFTNIQRGKLELSEGETFRVKHMVDPYELQESVEVVWSTSDAKVASVKSGRVSAESVGEAVITASAGDISASFTIKVSPYEVTSFNLQKSVELMVDEEVLIDVTDIKPEQASVSSIQWSIEPEDVASCRISDGQLYVVGEKKGSAVLTGTGHGISKTCDIEVYSTDVSKITITNLTNPTSNHVYTGYSVDLQATILPDFALDKTLKWSVSPSASAKITKISEDQTTVTVEAIYANPVTVTAEATNGVKGTYLLEITPSDATRITLKAENSTFKQGLTTRVSATIQPDIAQDNTKLTWSADYPDMVQITPSANTLSATIKGLSVGYVTIYAKAENGVRGSVGIQITEPDITNISVSQTNPHISPDGSYGYTNTTSKITVEGYNAGNGQWQTITNLNKITFSSDKESVAKVDFRGNITAVGHGVARITVTSYGKTATMLVRSYKKSLASPYMTTYALDYEEEFTYTDLMNDFVKWNKLVPNEVAPIYMFDKGAVYYDSSSAKYRIDKDFNVSYKAVPVTTSNFSYWKSAVLSGVDVSHELISGIYPRTSNGREESINLIDTYYPDKTTTKTILYRLEGAVLASYYNSEPSTCIEYTINKCFDTSVPESNSNININFFKNKKYMYLSPDLDNERLMNDITQLPRGDNWVSSEKYNGNPYFKVSDGWITHNGSRDGKLTITCTQHPERTLMLEVVIPTAN